MSADDSKYEIQQGKEQHTHSYARPSQDPPTFPAHYTEAQLFLAYARTQVGK